MAKLPNVKAGETVRVNDMTGRGYTDVSCSATGAATYSPAYSSGLTPVDYIIKMFKDEPVTTQCDSQNLNYVPVRTYANCGTSNTANCGYNYPGVNAVACNRFEVLLEDSFKGGMKIGDKSVAQVFGNTYKVFVSSSKTGYEKEVEISDIIRMSTGKMIDSSYYPYGTKPNQDIFTVVTRKDVGGETLRFRLEGKNAKQTNSSTFDVPVAANSLCPDGYDGRGVADVVVGDDLAGEGPNPRVRLGRTPSSL